MMQLDVMEIHRVRLARECGLAEAKEIVRKQTLRELIEAARSVEDLKTILIELCR